MSDGNLGILVALSAAVSLRESYLWHRNRREADRLERDRLMPTATVYEHVRTCVKVSLVPTVLLKGPQANPLSAVA